LSQTFSQSILDYGLAARQKNALLEKNWDGLVMDIVERATTELSVPNTISENILTQMFNLTN